MSVPFERGTDGPRVVMVGVDGSVNAMRAAAYAAGLARRQGAHLVVVFVALPSVWIALGPVALAPLQEQTFQELAAEMRQQIRARAEELCVSVSFLFRRGDPYAQLLAVADEVRADMVVVGAATHAGRRLVGSIAARLVRAGRWPVVVVP
jgi:nucleotide-binding universal stress UspA family protein